MSRWNASVFSLGLFFCGCAATGELDAPENRIPIANAGPNLNAQVGVAVDLSGHRSIDRDDDPLTYRWTLSGPEGSTATLNATHTREARFTPDTPGTYDVELIVNDGIEDSEPDSLIVTATAIEVVQPNRIPIANAGFDQNVNLGQVVQLDGTNSSDADGDTLTYMWRMISKPSGSLVRLSADAIPRPSFVTDQAGDYVIELIVNDGRANSDVSTLTVRAFAQNAPPIANAGPNVEVATGTRVQLNGGSSYDANDDELIYTWSFLDVPAGSLAALNSIAIVNPSFTADRDGEFRLQLVVNDGTVDSMPSFVTVTASTANIAPVAHAGTNRAVPVGLEAFVDGSLSHDANDDELTYQWSFSTRPNGSQATLFDAHKVIARFTPDVAGNFVVQLIVNDGKVASPPASVTLTATINNVAPLANAGPDQTLLTGGLVRLDGRGSSDPDNDTLTYRWSFAARPAGSMAMLSNTTTVQPTFTTDRDGTYVVQLIVHDGLVDSTADSVVITSFTPSTPQPAAKGDVVMTEYMRDPNAISDALGEWFEIYNPTNTLWDLENCVISDLGSNEHTISDTIEIPAGEYRVLAISATPGFTPDYVYNNFNIGNSGGDEIIITCSGVEISRVVYTASWPAATGASNQLLGSKTSETDNDVAANWCVSVTPFGSGDLGTPRAANEFQSACQ